jgi:hypothetical protein
MTFDDKIHAKFYENQLTGSKVEIGHTHKNK